MSDRLLSYVFPVFLILTLDPPLSSASDSVPVDPRPKHLFTIRGASNRLLFGNRLGDIYFEPRHREVFLTDSDHEEIWIFDASGFFLDRFGKNTQMRSPKSVTVLLGGEVVVVAEVEGMGTRMLSFDPRGRFNGFFPPEWNGGESANAPPSLRGGETGPAEWERIRFQPDSNDGTPSNPPPVENRFPNAEPDLPSLGRIERGPDNCLYVVNSTRKRIEVYDEEGNLRSLLKGGAPSSKRAAQRTSGINASGLAISLSGDVYVTDLTRGVVVIYGPDGKEKGTIGQRGGAPGKLSFPIDLTFDENENLYVVDRHRHTVLVFDPQGEFLNEFGGRGSRDGYFYYPTAICSDDENRLWIADGSGRVQVFAIPYTNRRHNLKNSFRKVGGRSRP